MSSSSIRPDSKIPHVPQNIPDRPVYKPMEPHVHERPLSEVIQKMGERLKELKEANKIIKSATKQINSLDKIIAKEEAALPLDYHTDERGPKANKFSAKRFVLLNEVRGKHADNADQKRKVLQEASQWLKEVAKHDKLLHPSAKETPEVKKVKAFVKKINKEIYKQDEIILKAIEKQLGNITGKNIFSSIFGTKTISKKDIPELHELAEGLKKVKNHLGPHVSLYQERFDKLEMQLGRALLNSHGYKTEKDIDRFLKLPFGKLDYSVADVELMVRFIAIKYPQKEISNVVGEIRRSQIQNVIVELLNKKELTPEEIEQGHLLLQQIENIDQSKPFFEKAQNLRFQLHVKLHPNYLKAPSGGQSEIDQLLKEYREHQKNAEHLKMESEQEKKLPHFEQRLKANAKALSETKNQLLHTASNLEMYSKHPEYKAAVRKALVNMITMSNPKILENYDIDLERLKSISAIDLQVLKPEIANRSETLNYFIEELEAQGAKEEAEYLKEMKQQYDTLLLS